MDCNWRAYGELARRREGKDLLSVEIDADLVGLTEKIDALHFAFGLAGGSAVIHGHQPHAVPLERHVN
jgi:hypothetical protein